MKATAAMPGRALEQVTDPVQAFALYHFLAGHGVSVSLNEPPLRVALGEIPFLDTPYTLVLHDPDQWNWARRLIDRYREGLPPVRGVIWHCTRCGEEHEPEFASCWHCGTDRA